MRLNQPARIIVCCLLAIAPVAWGEEENLSPATLRELVEQSIDNVQVFAGDAKQPARPLITLRWANSTRGSEDGATVLYVHEGCPIAAACVFPLRGNIIHEFDALKGRRTVARRKHDSDLIWQPAAPDVTFAPIPAASPPGDSTPSRLRQMKSLAEQFQASMLGWEVKDSLREELRLLPHPLFRYDANKDADVLDGAVFAFVTGTDPEALLLIEAAKEGDAARWQFAFVRRTTAGLEGRHGTKVVWTAEPRPDGKDPEKPHFSLSTRIPPSLLPIKEQP